MLGKPNPNPNPQLHFISYFMEQCTCSSTPDPSIVSSMRYLYISSNANVIKHLFCSKSLALAAHVACCLKVGLLLSNITKCDITRINIVKNNNSRLQILQCSCPWRRIFCDDDSKFFL